MSIIVDIQFPFTCGELKLHRNTVKWKDFMSLIVDALL